MLYLTETKSNSLIKIFFIHSEKLKLKTTKGNIV